MTNRKHLVDVAPSNNVGSLTGRQYEYQHEQATMGALEMLAHDNRHCVYCEWHDDFVVEAGQDLSLRYHFHQVKTKLLSQGPWTFHELFGLSLPKSPANNQQAPAKRGPPKAAKPLTVADDAIFRRLLAHDAQFGTNCGGFMFVTNTGVHPVAQTFLDAVAGSTTLADLATNARTSFDHLARGYCSGSSPLLPSTDELFARLKRFIVASEQGSLKEASALNEICDRIFEYSEIDLKMSERKHIARQLVALIRSKATDRSVKHPVDGTTLRAKKGVVVAEVLSVLSLSHEGYLALRQGGARSDLVKTLSRLDRFIRSSGMEQYTSQICSFKAKWDIWRTKFRHQISDSDHVVIVAKAKAIIATKKMIDEMVPLAKDAADALRPTLPPGMMLGAEEMLGLVFSIAADAEPK